MFLGYKHSKVTKKEKLESCTRSNVQNGLCVQWVVSASKTGEVRSTSEKSNVPRSKLLCTTRQASSLFSHTRSELILLSPCAHLEMREKFVKFTKVAGQETNLLCELVNVNENVKPENPSTKNNTQEMSKQSEGHSGNTANCFHGDSSDQDSGKCIT